LPTQDLLFSGIERYHGASPWGRVLDAGTGEHSLAWLRTLDSESLTLVTGAASRARRLEKGLRPQDQALAGNWQDPTLLFEERFDVVVADYLLGAIEGFAPYYQGQLFARLRPHVAGVLYLVGKEPLPETAPTEGGQAILELERLRDACILLAQHRCYREFPQAWVHRSLENSGFEVLSAWRQDIVYGAGYIERQLKVCSSKLRFFKSVRLAQAMATQIEDLRSRAVVLAEIEGGIALGSDYVVVAEPRS
jgi:hypothetical protein